MTLNEYQKQAMGTCLPTSNNLPYMLLNLQGEVGELSSKLAKAIRKEQLFIGSISEKRLAEYNSKSEFKITCNNRIFMQEDGILNRMDELKKEAGDVLWQLSGLCSVLGWSLEDVAQMNLDKLAARKKAGTIDGNGDGVDGKERTV